ncbi:MAG: FTR1 family protein [Verrucomicrobiota bacterium JB024]|nr:FTR1 family protein [Verrucomicrobiota bacterium JB024]
MNTRVLFLLVCALLPAWVFAEQGLTEDYAPVVQAIVERGDAAIDAYTPANTVETGNEFSRLYFDIFEGSGMEFTLNLKNSSLLLKIESGFSLMISQSMSGKPKEQLQKSWDGLKGDLDYAVVHYSSGGEMPSFWGKTVQSFLILFREGIEAMLVVAALVAYLRRSGFSDKVKVIWWGCGLALLASVLAAWLLDSVIQASGANREMLEGVTMLIAAMVLIYVSYWLTAKKDADRWQAFVKEKMDKAIGEGSLFALGFVAFLAVFREGAETILFYQALIAGSSGQQNAIWAGVGLATVGLVLVYGVVRLASIRLPLRLFFGATAVLLFAMAFVFVGQGILELQVAGLIHTTSLEGWPMMSLLGIFPTRETMIGQALVLATIPTGWLWLKWKRSGTARRQSPQEA